MDGIMGPAIVVLTILNWILYHKVFNVCYFNFSKAFAGELVGCVFFAFIEFLIIAAAGEWVLGILGWILKLALIIIAVLTGILLIYVIYLVIKNPQKFKEGILNFSNNTNSKEDSKHDSANEPMDNSGVTTDSEVKTLGPNL